MQQVGRIGVALVLGLGLLLRFLPAMAQPADGRPSRALPEVDLQLILAVDCSRSIDSEEFALQTEGYVAAFLHPAIARAIQSGPQRRIAVTYVQWAGPTTQIPVVDWTIIDGPQTAALFAQRIGETPRQVFGGGTSLSGVIDYARRSFEEQRPAAVGGRRVLDISGDGTNNIGRQVPFARDEAISAGLIINGLTILNEQPWLDDYFRDNVVGGPGAFVIAAADYGSFASAILAKLIREIASAATPQLAELLAP